MNINVNISNYRTEADFIAAVLKLDGPPIISCINSPEWAAQALELARYTDPRTIVCFIDNDMLQAIKRAWAVAIAEAKQDDQRHSYGYTATECGWHLHCRVRDLLLQRERSLRADRQARLAESDAQHAIRKIREDHFEGYRD